MELKFLQQINESSEKKMSQEELVTYLELLYKKCNKSAQKDFMEYLGKKCDLEDPTIEACAKKLHSDDKKCGEVTNHLEGLSEKLDENSLMYILGKSSEEES